MRQNSIDNNLQRNVSSCYGTSKFCENHVQLLLPSITVNTHNFIAVNDNTNRVTTS